MNVELFDDKGYIVHWRRADISHVISVYFLVELILIQKVVYFQFIDTFIVPDRYGVSMLVILQLIKHQKSTCHLHVVDVSLGTPFW